MDKQAIGLEWGHGGCGHLYQYPLWYYRRRNLGEIQGLFVEMVGCWLIQQGAKG